MTIFKHLPLAIAALVWIAMPLRPANAQEDTRPDLMTFAHGVLPLSVETGGSAMRVDMTAAIAAIDGNPGGFNATAKPGTGADTVEITYALPALTRFDRFAIPNILETPSPSQTFFRNIEVLGSASAADAGFVTLATGTLSTHEGRDMMTELALAADQPEVMWIRLRLSDGIKVERDKTYFEFSELIANGTQRDVELSDGFAGVWKGRDVKIELAQDGATVTGCYDSNSELAGTVEGRVLRALGHDSAGIASQFILIAADNGALSGLRSTNGAPFKPYNGEASDKPPACLSPEPPVLGCGAIVHGIGFDYDSDVIRDGSQTLIAALFDGLKAEGGTGIVITGHSSSEGQADYNRDLSQRRAQAVVDALVALGLDVAQISASGRGEDDPIASNADEAGRSMNRRVEVQCAG
ncbi:MAG: OmpA family protein [Rhodobacteraceae bacterium]|nr:OmpA family protein [Paracoccaceae bacterium]